MGDILSKQYTWLIAIFIIGLVVCCFAAPVTAANQQNIPESFSGNYPVQAYHDAEGNTQLVEIDIDVIEPYFEIQSVEYYAYMDIHSAEKQLIPVILEARNRVIVNFSWVDNSAEGWITDRYGNFVESVPHFNEVFPEDWENPWYPAEYNPEGTAYNPVGS